MNKQTITALCLMLSMGIACSKQNDKKANACAFVPAKVLRYDCDIVIIQVLTSDLIGDAQWVNVHNGNRYDNVVFVKTGCDPIGNRNDPFGIFYVKLGPPVTNLLRCGVQCQAIPSSPPTTEKSILEQSQSACDNE
jgi:hypothetical protein